MLIDTHCHIYLNQFKNDIDSVLDRAYGAGVNNIFMPAINLDSLNQMERLFKRGNSSGGRRIQFHKMIGLHPTEINEGGAITEAILFQKSQEPDIVAVGETGLDYHWSDQFKKEQKESLRLHCSVAKAVDKPIVLHNRESTADLLSIIEDEQDGNLRGIWHCFNGSAEEGRRAIDLGLHLGIGGVLTFKNAGVDKTVGRLPLEKMVLETDAPYLAPSPKRGKRNEPAFIKFTAARLAEVMDLPFEVIADRTSKTALRLFGIQESEF